MTSNDLQAPAEEHREQIWDLLRTSLNLSATHATERTAWLPLEKIRCVFDDGRVVAAAGARDLRQWFGGREIACSGIWGVATVPERRGSGLATRAVAELLHEARANGQPISALYPATLRPYRAMGYELAGTLTRHEVALDDLPRGTGGPFPVEELDVDRDLEDVRACYRAAVSPHTGPIDCDDPDWWRDRILGPWFSDDVHRAVLVRSRRGGVDAYAAFRYEKAPANLEIEYLLDCKHMVASTLEGLASLLAYFRGFRGLGRGLRFAGPPAHPLALLVEEQRVRPEWTFRWMLRLLDVPAALEQRGYPPISGETVIAVEDGLFPQNRGPWRVVADEGTVKVEEVTGEHVPAIPIGTLSSMFSGFLSPFDAVALGLLERGPAEFLARLFAGPSPWMHDFF